MGREETKKIRALRRRSGAASLGIVDSTTIGAANDCEHCT